MSIGRTIARNTLFNAAGRAWEAVVGLVLTPYILYRIGLPAWGLWGLTGAFTSYISLADFGLSSGFAKFIAEDHAKNDTQSISRTVSTGRGGGQALGCAASSSITASPRASAGAGTVPAYPRRTT